LIADLPDQAAKEASSQMLRAEDVPADRWIQNGWGADGLVVLVTHVDVDPILEHLRSLMSSSSTDSSPGILGVCRPLILESILTDGDSELAHEIVGPCEAIVLESPQAEGGWAIYGDDRMLTLLDGCRISHALKLDTGLADTET